LKGALTLSSVLLLSYLSILAELTGKTEGYAEKKAESASLHLISIFYGFYDRSPTSLRPSVFIPSLPFLPQNTFTKSLKFKE